MDLLIKEFEFLQQIIKSNKKAYISIISKATSEQLGAVFTCIELCRKYKLVQGKYFLTKVTCQDKIPNVIKIISMNRVKVKVAIGTVLSLFMNTCMRAVQNAA